MAVARYISLTKLIQPLLILVDKEKIAVSAAADCLSDLPTHEQTALVDIMDKLEIISGRSQRVKIKKYSKEGTLTPNVIESILTEVRPMPMQVTLKHDRLRQFFPESFTVPQIEEVLFSLLEDWRSKQQTITT